VLAFDEPSAMLVLQAKTGDKAGESRVSLLPLSSVKATLAKTPPAEGYAPEARLVCLSSLRRSRAPAEAG
jgi:hypothetical protein